jgi:type IV pilus assembly protein PilV
MPAARAQGFTLVEVLVALVIISIGMLGIAKMQALALSGTGVSRSRSLAAIQAASLADAMHANRQYWSTGLPTAAAVVATATNGTAASADGTLSGALGTVAALLSASTPAYSIYCNNIATPCSGTNMAAADFYNWALDLKAVLPNSTATVTCNGTNAPTPADCIIKIDWTEVLVAADATQGAAAAAGSNAAIQQPTYILYVVP